MPLIIAHAVRVLCGLVLTGRTIASQNRRLVICVWTGAGGTMPDYTGHRYAIEPGCAKPLAHHQTVIFAGHIYQGNLRALAP